MEINNKDQFLEKFKKEHIQNNHKEKVIEIKENYLKNKEEIQKKLIKEFMLVCEKASILQRNGLKTDIKYIYFSMLRTKLLENKGKWRIDLYDEKWFLDKEECFAEIDFNFVYEPLFAYIKELSQKKKEYSYNKRMLDKFVRFQITEKDLEDIKLKEANRYHIFALNTIRASLESFLECSYYKEMNKKEDIIIMAGEYMDTAIQINIKHKLKV